MFRAKYTVRSIEQGARFVTGPLALGAPQTRAKVPTRTVVLAPAGPTLGGELTLGPLSIEDSDQFRLGQEYHLEFTRAGGEG